MRLSAAPAATGARASGRFRHARDRRSWADRRGRRTAVWQRLEAL